MNTIKTKIDQGFILCAGYGNRMRPLTDNKPKPMVEINRTPMIDHILDNFNKNGISRIVINTHYKADVIEKHLENNQNPPVIISHELELLHTGGGLKNALHYFDGKDFFVSSGDSYLENGPAQSPYQRLQDFWNPESMDILMLLEPVNRMAITKGVGDYDLDSDGKAIRSLDQTGKYMFTSLRINSSRIFDGCPETPFNYLDLMDKAQEQGRLYGLVHDGLWHHISTPEDVKNVTNYLNNLKSKEKQAI
jgi:MurNAc alpha-1-phosphate uridylyltransferase